jgi:predicted nucleic acid-binding protein
MPLLYVVDASVFINAFNPYEVGHAESFRLMERWRAEATPLAAPTLLLPELAAAVARGGDDTALGQQFAREVRRRPHLTLVPLGPAVAQQAADLAATHRLRGSDAGYAAVALRVGATLVTRDREQRERLNAVLTARYPEEGLATT